MCKLALSEWRHMCESGKWLQMPMWIWLQSSSLWRYVLTDILYQLFIVKMQIGVHFADPNFYHQRMRVGTVFSHTCLSVCLSMCPSVQAITFEPLHIECSFMVCRYIFTISRSSLQIKVIGWRSHKKNDSFTYFNKLIMCIATGH